MSCLLQNTGRVTGVFLMLFKVFVRVHSAVIKLLLSDSVVFCYRFPATPDIVDYFLMKERSHLHSLGLLSSYDVY